MLLATNGLRFLVRTFLHSQQQQRHQPGVPCAQAIGSDSSGFLLYVIEDRFDNGEKPLYNPQEPISDKEEIYDMTFAMRKPRTITPEEYLLLERRALEKSELIDGVIYAMAGASLAHIGSTKISPLSFAAKSSFPTRRLMCWRILR